MAVGTSYDVNQLTSAVDLIKQHKTAIRSAFGMSGTGFEQTSSSSLSADDLRRLQNSLNVGPEQAQLIANVWPIYQQGFEDGQSQNSNTQSQSSQNQNS